MIYVKNFFYEKYKNKIKEDEKRVRLNIKQHYVQIYKGKLFKKVNIQKELDQSIKLEYQSIKSRFPKIIVFDLDETLGSFSDMETLWSGLNQYIKINNRSGELLQQSAFNQLMDIYPEFLRTGILEILSYIIGKKRLNECFRLYIYTNNQCEPSWTNLISKYISSKFELNNNINIFERNICAFKSNDKIVEPRRTTHEKTFNDFIHCTMLSKNIELCFIDNTFFDKMKHDKVYYIQPRAYYHGLTYKIIMDRFVNTPIFTEYISPLQSSSDFYEFIYNWFQMKCAKLFIKIKVEDEYAADLIVYQKMMYHIKEFFYMSTRNTYTKRMKYNVGRFTKKNR